jgi:hypothetical protein
MHRNSSCDAAYHLSPARLQRVRTGCEAAIGAELTDIAARDARLALISVMHPQPRKDAPEGKCSAIDGDDDGRYQRTLLVMDMHGDPTPQLPYPATPQYTDADTDEVRALWGA